MRERVQANVERQRRRGKKGGGLRGEGEREMGVDREIMIWEKNREREGEDEIKKSRNR